MSKQYFERMRKWAWVGMVWIGFTACSLQQEVEEPEPELYRVGEVTDGDVVMVLYSEAPLVVGYQSVWVDVRRSGERMEVSDLELGVEMQMEAHAHGAPLEQPGDRPETGTALYRGAVVFTMPSGSMGSWSISLDATLTDGSTVGGTLEVDVASSNRVQVFQTSDGSSYVLAWVQPEDPKEGANDLELTLHKRDGMYSFPPVTDVEMAVTPWMPSMDHGSENNVDPVHDTIGHYKGEVVFNMTGDWEVYLDLEIPGSDPVRRTFELRF